MTGPIPMMIAVRGHASPLENKVPDNSKADTPTPRNRKALPSPSRWSLVFDTETTTDHAQRLRIGFYQVRERDRLHEGGLFYEVGELSARELALVLRYVRKNGLELRTREEFVREVVYRYGYDYGGQIIGFNLPFDLSRLAISVGTSHAHDMRGGFSLKLLPEKWRPPVLVKHLNSRAAFMRFAAAGRATDGRSMRKKGFKSPAKTGCFQDVKTLAAALMGKSHSLASLAGALQTENGKHETDEHGGALTNRYLDYAAADVQVTWQCYVALRERYAEHGLPGTPPHRIYSEASLGKAYLAQMGIMPWRKLQPNFPADLLGHIMTSYYGGRAEVRIRREVVQVLYCDFRSMYPTVCTLMGLWSFVIAEGVTWIDATDETRWLLASLDLQRLQDPSAWLQLPVLVQVAPSDDVLPVRARYDEGNRTIGLNRLTSQVPLWYTLADCLASKVLRGKAPSIVRAIRFSPKGPQTGLKSIRIGGNDHFAIDPTKDDFYKRVIELRGEIQAGQRAAKARGDFQEAEQLGSYQQMLKLLANSTSYGIFAELNVQSYDRSRQATCHGCEDIPFETRTRSLEEPGTHFHPLIATLITGAARLMLALAERFAADQGIGWGFCDTDSLALARPADMGDAEFLERALAVTARFEGLSPYADQVPLFKVEDENFRLENGKVVNGEHEPLYALAISAKRYGLFNLDPEGRPVIRKALAHGLGHLLPPYGEMEAPADIPVPATDPRDMGIQRWHHDLWYLIIQATLEGRPDQVDLSRLPNVDRPAASRYGASTPQLLHWVDSFNHGRRDHDRIKPFNFMLSFQVSAQKVNAAIAEGRLDVSGKKEIPAPVAPYDSNIEKAVQSCFDRKTGELVPAEYLLTYREALAGYHLHSESKFSNGEAFDRGNTERRHIKAVAVEYIGKEANRWEEQYHVGEIPEAQIEYGFSSDGQASIIRVIRKAARKFGQNSLAREAGMSRQQLAAIVTKETKPRPASLRLLLMAITSLAQRDRNRAEFLGKKTRR